MTVPTIRSYRSIFAPSTRQERAENFESYWVFTQGQDGAILESEQDLSRKKTVRERYQAALVRSRKPLVDPELFYRNYVEAKDDPGLMDPKTRLLTCLYKFARHEWVGITCAWGTTPAFSDEAPIKERISRYHLCEEFCHVRLFDEILRTFHVEPVWVPPSERMRKLYTFFTRLPERVMAAPAFVSELMGLTFYRHLDALLDPVLADEPEARDRVRALLREITADELSHVGLRRNYLGPIGIRFARAILPTMYRFFFRDIPEAEHLFSIEAMIEDGLAFDYSSLSPEVVAGSWVPTYLRNN
jgi:hypothetical protein